MPPALTRREALGRLLFPLAVVGACIALAYAGVLGYRALPHLNDPFNDATFDAAVWATFHQSMDPNNPRGSMARDLEARLLETRPTRPEVIALLGPPDLVDERALVSYNLGMWSGFRMDFDSFDIQFDAAGRVAAVTIIQH